MAGRVQDFPPDTVTYFSAGHFFLVNWSAGGQSLRAISDQPPGLEDVRCRVRYGFDDGRGGLQIDESGHGGGYFKGDCAPVRFNFWRGEDLSASCECGLDHYRVQIVDGRVFVDTTHRLPFAWQY